MTRRYVKHGMRGTRIYKIWEGMKQRCYNSNNTSYAWYGGKGIRVCEDWHDFVPFMEWAFANGYTDELTIDRVESDKDYTPDNCRWITKEQNASRVPRGKRPDNAARNAKDSKRIEYNGKEQTIKEWAEEYNMTYKDLYHRLRKNWTMERALTQPLKKK